MTDSDGLITANVTIKVTARHQGCTLVLVPSSKNDINITSLQLIHTSHS